MKSINLATQINDQVTPMLAALEGKLRDRTQLNAMIAGTCEVLTRRWIVEVAAPSRHTTAERLGATPTGYLARRANAVEGRGTPDAAIIALGAEAEIFARVDGPVTVTARNSKYLTIPATAEAFGKRAREIAGLFPVTFKTGSKALAKKEDGKLKVFYWLKESVVLPQDPDLLPDDEAYLDAAELGARDYITATTTEGLA